MKKNNPVTKTLWEYGMILLGSAIYAVCFNWCFQPNNISMGGFTGIAQVINRFLPFLPVGMTVLVLNIPLFYIGVRKLGLKLLISSLFAMAAGSLMIDGLAMAYTFHPMDPLLATIYGGVLLGLSMGLLMRVGATTGGTELAARLLKLRLKHLILYALTFKNINNALYGIVAMYICSLTMDTVVYGAIGAKMAYVISDKSEAVTQRLLAMNLGVTLLNGQGAYAGGSKQVVLCAFKRSQIAAIKGAVTEIDPNAFIIVCEAHEVLGEGFGTYSPDGL